ncbi:MAG: hypothetical protein LC627_02385, partial [Verrucomicrobiaceae bacterium]|nr:hypothetical protein [Verrucomicrobiaceae bacterium]
SQLARSGHHLPWFQRPAWRGAFIVSIWSAFVLAIAIGPEWSSLRQYFSQLGTTFDPQAFLQTMVADSQSRGFDGVGFALRMVETLLRPLLGIAFVLLFFDARTRM